ncbi:hypothetical protein B0A49_06168 [Cryomyces minteri]|uniref:Uncharacterized protein n=1 Tax=Cryomyces minteri TaxID=331657 RepID=A0A4U0XBD5_9PEZI|nr:hypothetical protein B0A49_06168 [Cryomyces minteri]
MATGTIVKLVVRDLENTPSSSLNPTMFDLLIALLALGTAAALSVGALYFLRGYRNSKKDALLPTFNEKPSKVSKHRRLTVRPYESVYVYQERRNLIANSSSPPSSLVPEIRITFPEEVDDAGKRQSGKVVVVRVGETSVGLEPFVESLPSYQESESDRFQSLDLDRIGGLKEETPR